MDYFKQGALDLEACEREPIDFIGAMQAPYALIAWRPDTRAVVVATQNLEEMAGVALSDLARLGVEALFSHAPPVDDATFFKTETRPVCLANGRSATVRKVAIDGLDGLVIDPTSASSVASEGFNAIVEFNQLVERHMAVEDLDLVVLCESLAQRFRKLSGYDRVMVYEFDADWNGHVIAEDASDRLESRFIGQSFPSSDIPRRARELFLRNRVRPLVDIDADPVRLLCLEGSSPDQFDIGELPERAVSPIHLQYLKNMGVTSTLTIALVVRNELWGLLTCHHYDSPKCLSTSDLALCRVLCELMSQALNRVRDRSRLTSAQRADQLGAELRALAHTSPPDMSLNDLLAPLHHAILSACEADNALFSLAGETFEIGSDTPQRIDALYLELAERLCATVSTSFATNHVSAFFPELGQSMLPNCAGVAIVRNPAHETSLLVSRRAVPRLESWAGDPEKRVTDMGRLSPRASFELWQAETKDKAASWPTAHQETLFPILTLLTDVGWTMKRRKAEMTAKLATAQAEKAAEELAYWALHDALTDLPNRRYLERALDKLSEHPGGRNASRIAALHMDLDRFKSVNDHLGHSAGDKVLVHVADVLRSLRRQTDFVARLGGDEFIILAHSQVEKEQLAELAESIISALSWPLEIDGQIVRIGASVGIAVAPAHSIKPSDLLSRADVALYEAKRLGRGRFQFVSDRMEHDRAERRRLGEEAMEGLERNEFELFFQPQYDAATRDVAGAEALLRWNHPERGLLTPDVFMPAATEVGVVDKLDNLAIARALEARETWEKAGLMVPKVSVNISAKRLRDIDVKAMVIEDPRIPKYIAFELLETMDLNEIDSASRWNIAAIRDAGIELEIDDFGTGHTSILSLLQLRPARLKIDKDLVLPAIDSETVHDLIRLIVRIAQTLKVGVTAEGVETLAHASLMTELGCDRLQGYAFARPMPADQLPDHVLHRKHAKLSW